MIARAAGVAALAALVPAGSVAAQSVDSESEVFRDKTRVLDERLEAAPSERVRLSPRRVVTPSRAGVARWEGGYRGPYLGLARAAAERYRVPVGLFLRLVERESRWDAAARSHKGAIGLAQLMPGTARRLGVDPTDPGENLRGGARYLRAQYEVFESWRLALAAYNAGPGAVRRHGGVPPFRETRAYVRAVLGQ